MAKPSLPAPLAWTLLWAALVLTALALRPALPVDETRYLSVAWEMWLRGDYLVPHLNGETYSHKPPLLFWLINAGWAAFGINDVTPRVVAPVFALAALFLTARLADLLWPASQARVTAPVLLLGSVFWALFSTLTMFDMLMATWTLVGMLGLAYAWRGRAGRGWSLFALAVGLGVLSKGPVILVYLLPAALAAPWWAVGATRPIWRRWYAALAAATLGGAALALAWAVPAGISGGAAYRDAIFWGQSAGRMVDSFAHQQPIWWYVAILPALLLPVLLWPTLLRGLWRIVRRADATPPDAGLRLAVVWIGATFVILSAFSGKAPHYLLPVLPACALIGAVALERSPRWPADGTLVRPFAVLATLVVVTVHLGAHQRLGEAYDLKDFSLRLGALQRDGYDLAYFGNYHGQFQFLGRLARPIAEIGAEPDWLRSHAKAKVVAYHYTLPDDARAELITRFRSGFLALWDRDQVLADPTVVHRGQRADD